MDKVSKSDKGSETTRRIMAELITQDITPEQYREEYERRNPPKLTQDAPSE